MQGQQFQCPNCRGYKSNDKRGHIKVDPRTGLPWKHLPLSTITTLLLIFGWGTLSLGIFLGIAHIALGNWLVGLSLILLIAGNRRDKTYDNLANPSIRVVQHHCSCYICGYQWTWREDQPYPPMRYNPAVSSSLLIKGAQRLEDEQQVAAWYIQQQQRSQR